MINTDQKHRLKDDESSPLHLLGVVVVVLLILCGESIVNWLVY